MNHMLCSKLNDEVVTKVYLRADLATLRMQLVLSGVAIAGALFAALKLIP